MRFVQGLEERVLLNSRAYKKQTHKQMMSGSHQVRALCIIIIFPVYETKRRLVILLLFQVFLL